MSRPARRAPPTSQRQGAAARVSARSLAASKAVLQFGSLRFACALGRSGCRVRKREGDGATPVGRWVMRTVLYRADRVRRPATQLPVAPIGKQEGWCDAPGDRNYNRLVTHPYPARAESLWRRDALYDVVVVLGYNDRPRINYRGSAIFLHVAARDLAPTAGCIAMARAELLRLLRHLGPGARLTVLCRRRRAKLPGTARS